MELVGLNPEHYNRFPADFSGGQRQRIGVARALALRPQLIICDEPVSALDVSIQAQVINLLADLQDELGLTYLFITHDLSVVRHVSDRIAVMYLGRMVEHRDRRRTSSTRARHPYTKALLSALPAPDPDAADSREHDRPQRRPALGRRPAQRVPLPPALPEGPRGLPRAAAPARAGRLATRPTTRPRAGTPWRTGESLSSAVPGLEIAAPGEVEP